MQDRAGVDGLRSLAQDGMHFTTPALFANEMTFPKLNSRENSET